MKRAIALCIGLWALAGPAAAEAPVAVVEDVQGKVTGAEFMDYVTPKTVIKVPAGGSVVISYMKSCQREKTDCDSTQSHATTKATSEAAATVLRSLASEKGGPKIKTQLTLYGASPMVEAKGKGTLVVERLDVKGERQQIELTGSQQKGKFYDFAGANRALTPGGIYSASFGTSKILFLVDTNAKPGATPIVGRLIRLD